MHTRDDLKQFEYDLNALIDRAHNGASTAEEAVYACAQERALLDFAERAFVDNRNRRVALAELIRTDALPPPDTMPRVVQQQQAGQQPVPDWDDGQVDDFQEAINRMRARAGAVA